MFLEAVWIGFAFACGLAVKRIGLPPLIGYLTAGFVISSLPGSIAMPEHADYVLSHVAHLGVLLLLFSVGLKLNLVNLIKPEVIGGGVMHFAISIALIAPGLYFFLDGDVLRVVLLASALAFSSTVLAAKILESKRELRAFHGRVAIGILVVQDLLALVVVSVAGNATPSPWALLVLLLPLLRPVLHRMLDASGHDELQLLFGMLAALVLGGYGFELLGLNAELGALLFGAMLAGHRRAVELSRTLWGLKEFFLVGFFLQIGIDGIPGSDAWVFALVMMVLLPLKGALFFALLVAFKLRARSAFLTSLSLSQYSEFGLIVASLVLPEWLVPLALTVALSFIVSAPLNRKAHPLYDKLAPWLIRWERDTRHPDEQPVSLGQADVLVMGMGRTGKAAYDYLQEKYNVVALDSDPDRVSDNKQAGRSVFFADAEDPGFWQGLDMGAVRSVVLTINDVEAKVIATRNLRASGFDGLIVSHSMHQDEADQIMAVGADQTYLTMSEAGVGLAEHVLQSGKV
jgi:predicted Kef-type K+ transport protein